MKKAIKKLFKPVYQRVYNRFVETVLTELRENKTLMSEEVLNSQAAIKAYISKELLASRDLTRQLISEELFNHKTFMSGELQNITSCISEELKAQRWQLFHDIEHRIDRLLREIRLYQEVAAVNTAAFAEYRNIYSGIDVVIVGTGQTLDKYTKPIENAVHIGVNTAYKSDVKLDFIFVTDAGSTKNSLKNIGKGIESYKCKKFFGLMPTDRFEVGEKWSYIDPTESFSARAGATRFYHEGGSKKYIIYQNICLNPTTSYGTVAIPALHFALFTNPRNIYLVGLDTTIKGHFSRQEIEVVGELPKNVLENALPMICEGYQRMKDFAQTNYPDTEIISINPVGLAGLFKNVFTDKDGVLTEGNHNTNKDSLWNLSNDEMRAYGADVFKKIQDSKNTKQQSS
jgi:hypothetical protein